MLEKKNKEKYEKALGSGWIIGRLIGQGSYGSVYEVERDDLGVKYKSALKIISIPRNESELREIMAEGHDKSSARTYFESVAKEMTSELSVMSKLRGHTNIVSYEDHMILDHDDEIGIDILIRMELLTPLLSYLKEHPSDKGIVLKLGIDMCNALCVCEKYNIIHRDIKPANIFVSDAGDFKLGDFGVAKIVERTTTRSVGVGTSEYMAPEVIYGNGKYSSNVDIYSLGVVLYQMSNHMRLPFFPHYPEPIYASDKEEATRKRIAGEKLPIPDDADRQTWKVISRACEYNPNKRYSLANEMLLDLRRVLENKNIRANHSYEAKMLAICLMGIVVISAVLGYILSNVKKHKTQEVVSKVSSNDVKEKINNTENYTEVLQAEKTEERVSNIEKSFVEDDYVTEETLSVNAISENQTDETLDYDALYYPIIDVYIELLEDDFAIPDETKVPYSFKDAIRTENIRMEDMEYVYYDLDRNGIDELLIMLRNDVLNSNMIYAIYTIENNRVIPIEYSFLTISRDGTYFFEDGIVGKMKGGTGFDQRSYCRLDTDGFEWKVVETVAMVAFNYGNDVKYFSSDNQESIQEAPDDKPEIYAEITKAEMDDIISKYEIKANINSRKLSEYKNMRE